MSCGLHLKDVTGWLEELRSKAIKETVTWCLSHHWARRSSSPEVPGESPGARLPHTSQIQTPRHGGLDTLGRCTHTQPGTPPPSPSHLALTSQVTSAGNVILKRQPGRVAGMEQGAAVKS